MIAATKSEHDLRRPPEPIAIVAALIGEYTSVPADGRLTKNNIKAKRAAEHEKVNKELNEIDADVMRQLATMNLMGAISSSEIEVLQGVDEKVDRLSFLVNQLRPQACRAWPLYPQGRLPCRAATWSGLVSNELWATSSARISPPIRLSA